MIRSKLLAQKIISSTDTFINYTSLPVQKKICAVTLGKIFVAHGGYLQLRSVGSWTHAHAVFNLPCEHNDCSAGRH
jgi:hypothetical protein